MTAPEHAWLTIDGYFVGEPNDAVGRVEYIRADLCISRDDPALLAVVEALNASTTIADLVAELADIDMDETSISVRVMPDGKLVRRKSWAEINQDAKYALAAITEKMGLK